MIQNLACAFGRHRRNRRKVWHDSQDRRSICAGCRMPMIADHHGWRLFRPEDHSKLRLPHPRQRGASNLQRRSV